MAIITASSSFDEEILYQELAKCPLCTAEQLEAMLKKAGAPDTVRVILNGKHFVILGSFGQIPARSPDLAKI